MSKILQNSGFYHMGLSFLFVFPACVCQIFIFMSFWLNRKATSLLVQGLNLGPHTGNDLSGKKSTLLPLPALKNMLAFYKFLNIVDLFHGEECQ